MSSAKVLITINVAFGRYNVRNEYVKEKESGVL